MSSIFSIRKKGTEDYLPMRRGRGFSHDEPVLNGGPLGPRYFVSFKSAQTALTAWLQGAWTEDRGTSWSVDGPDDYAEMSIKPMPHRKDEDMEIVEYELKEVRTHARRKQTA